MKPLYLLPLVLFPLKPSSEEQAATVIAKARQVLFLQEADLKQVELKGTTSTNTQAPMPFQVWIKDKKLRVEYLLPGGHLQQYVSNGTKSYRRVNQQLTELPYAEVESMATSMKRSLQQVGLNLAFAQHPGAQLLMLSRDTSYQTQPCYLIGISFRGKPQFQFFIHKQTHQLLYESNESGSIAYEHYQQVASCQLPFQIREYAKSSATTITRKYELIRVNLSIEDDLFEVNQGLQATPHTTDH